MANCKPELLNVTEITRADRYAEWIFLGIMLLTVVVLNILSLSFEWRLPQYETWQLGAHATMFVYFVVFYYKEFKDGGTFVVPVARLCMPLWALGLTALFFSAKNSWYYAPADGGSILWQLGYLIVFALAVTAGDFVFIIKHPKRTVQVQWQLFVWFVDIPMCIGFGIIFVAAGLLSAPTLFSWPSWLPPDFASFTAGAVAFEVIAFNVIFAHLDRVPAILFRGKTPLLLMPNGEVAEHYPEFMEQWQDLWSKNNRGT